MDGFGGNRISEIGLVIGASGGIGGAILAELARRGTLEQALRLSRADLDVIDEAEFARASARIARSGRLVPLVMATGLTAPLARTGLTVQPAAEAARALIDNS